MSSPFVLVVALFVMAPGLSWTLYLDPCKVRSWILAELNSKPVDKVETKLAQVLCTLEARFGEAQQGPDAPTDQGGDESMSDSNESWETESEGVDSSPEEEEEEEKEAGGRNKGPWAKGKLNVVKYNNRGASLKDRVSTVMKLLLRLLRPDPQCRDAKREDFFKNCT